MRRHNHSLALVGILFYGCLVRAYGLFEPWASGHLGTGGARFSLHALNFVRYGYLATGFRPIMDAGWIAPGAYRLYTKHPPLLSILSDEEQGSGETGRREATRSIEWGAEAVGRMQ